MTTITDVIRDLSQPTPNQPPQVESNFGDSSEPLFSMYTKAAQDEDNKMVERWQKDADGIIIFVSRPTPYLAIHIVLPINRITSVRSIFRLSRCTPFRDNRGPEAKQPRYLRILSREHLWGSRRSERNTCVHPLPCHQTTPVLCSEICCLGEFSLVLEPGYERQLCSVGNIVEPMGTSIYPSDSASTVQPREASANTSILFQRCGQDAYSMGS